MNGLNITIADHLDGKVFEEEIEGASKYHDELRPAISKLRFILNEKHDLRTENPRGRAVALPTYFLQSVKHDCELSSAVELRKTQAHSVEVNATQAHEGTFIEPTSRGEMNGDSLPELPETRLAQISEVAWRLRHARI